MDVTVNAAALRAATAWVARIAPKKPTVPIYGGVHLRVTSEGLRLSATSFDAFVETTVTTAPALTPGRVVVPAHVLDAIIATVRPGDDVALHGGDRGVTVIVERAHWALPTLRAEDWPVFPEPGERLGDVDAGALAAALARTMPVASTNASELFLGGVQATFSATLTLAATDRYRLAVAEVPWAPQGQEWPAPATVPLDLLRAVADIEGTVTVRASDNMITFEAARHRVSGRLIATEFPRWRPLLPHPRDAATTVVTPVAELARALAQVGAPAHGDPIHVALAVSPDGVTARLANDPAAARAVVPARGVAGGPVMIVCSQRYLRDALTILGSPMAALHFFPGGPMTPFLITAAGSDGELVDDGYRHVVVPVRPRAGALEGGAGE